jgi:hypothetical protein
VPFTVKDWKDAPDATTPLSAAALEDMETRLSAYTDASVPWVTPSAMTGAAIASAITSLGSGGGIVSLRPGTYTVASTVTVPTGVRLVGAGKGATAIVPSSAITALRFNGASNASRSSRGGLEDVVVSGNGQTIARLVEAIYADRLEFDRVEFNSVVGCAFYGVDLWDSRWNDCRSNNAGASGVPAFLMRSTDTGITPADTVNNLHFNDCVWESFTGGALWVERNGGGTPSVIRLSGCKMESQVATGRFLRLSGAAYCSIANTRLHISGGSGGFDLAQVSGYYHDIRQLTMTSSGSVVPRTGLSFGESGLTSGWSYIEVETEFSQAPSVATLEYVNTPVNVTHGRIVSSGGTLLTGAVTYAAGHPLRQVAGAVSDASFYQAPPNGTLALDTTNNRLYVRSGGTWRYATLT